ncbi:hypothetical protein DIPPA_08109 [Diplonema papillatum]|nr:hypothetical protein DIPPA_08109 [Diplonema papillatum]
MANMRSHAVAHGYSLQPKSRKTPTAGFPHDSVSLATPESSLPEVPTDFDTAVVTAMAYTGISMEQMDGILCCLSKWVALRAAHG